MPYRYVPLPTPAIRALQAGGADAYGLPPERRVSDGCGIPCRHCMKPVPAGAEYLVIAYRPFETLQPYAETGPLFICAEPCEAGNPGAALPEILDSPDYILRGYDADERIVYGTGAVTKIEAFPARIEALFARPDVTFLHVRSSMNNCFQCRIERA